MRKFIVGVMGPGNDAKPKECELAYEVGKRIAEQGWVLLSGGRNVGVMDAVNRGAKSAGGLTLGISLTEDKNEISDAVDIAIISGLGSARNNLNVLTSDVVVAVGIGPGTASEVCLAMRAKKKIILLECSAEGLVFFKSLNPESVFAAQSPDEVVRLIAEFGAP